MIWQLLQQTLHTLATRKLQSGLVLFGIAWGTLCIILLLGLGNSFSKATQAQFAAFQQSFMFVALKRANDSSGSQRDIWLTENDLAKLRSSLSYPVSISPLLLYEANVQVNKQLRQVSVRGVAPLFFTNQLTKDTHITGRLLNPNDIHKKRRVTIIPDTLAKTWFDNTQSAIGQTIFIESVPFTVVGVLPYNIQLFSNGNPESLIYVPYATHLSLWTDNVNRIKFFLLFYPPSASLDTLKNEVKHRLAQWLDFQPDDERALFIFDIREVREFITNTITLVNFFLGFCGVLTLAVGGFGLANILVLLVTERTPELGLRMALGATPQRIMLQILLESVTLVIVGGLIGCLLALLIFSVFYLVPMPNWLEKPTVSLSLIFITLLSLTIIALTAGYFPARRAMRLMPAQALGGGP